MIAIVFTPPPRSSPPDPEANRPEYPQGNSLPAIVSGIFFGLLAISIVLWAVKDIPQ